MAPKNRTLMATVAVLFGLLTIVSGGKVALGLGDARAAAGAYVPFVVWFNFLAGFAYVAAGVAIWKRLSWAGTASTLILAATVIVGLAFGVHVLAGGAFEMRTLVALGLRIAVWSGIVFTLMRKTG